MEITEISQYKNRRVSGYMLNTGLNEENQLRVSELNRKIREVFGDLIIEQPGSALHITLMDWVAPLVSYKQAHDVLFNEVFHEYDNILKTLISGVGTFTVKFDSIRVSPAAIFIEGHDDGQFQHIRDSFLGKTTLPQGTKQPPKIIHCTIARFNEQKPLKEIQEFVGALRIDFEQEITGFRLVHETDMPMLNYEIIKTYALGDSL